MGEIKNITLSPTSFIELCLLFYEEDPHCAGMSDTFWWDPFTLSPCYSYNYKPIGKKPSAIRANDGLDMDLFIDTQDQDLVPDVAPLFPITVSFAVHASDKQPTRMHQVSPGFNHYVSVDVKKYSRLAKPYKTECISDWPSSLDLGIFEISWG